MGVFRDLMQQDQIEEQKKQADKLEVLEAHLGKDIDGDGRTGY